jgi:Calcineurin-like phosphoesterase
VTPPIFLALLVAAGCSHTRPFVRGPRTGPPPTAPIEHRLLLIGDAGAANPAGEPSLDLLAARVRLAPNHTTVVFLGDNVYETGMPEPSPIEGTAVEEALDVVLGNLYQSRGNAERRVQMQVDAVRVRGVKTIFIPGNHDWDQFGVGGWKRVLALQAYIRELNATSAEGEVQLLPPDGCPGPVAVDLGRHARLIVLDTQWWLELGSKPAPADNPAGCREVTEDGVATALTREIQAATAAGRRSIVVGHHPLASGGPHGGYVDPIIHLFPFLMFGKYVPSYVRWLPLPGFGTIAGWWRSFASPNAQDFSGPGNRHMRAMLQAAMARSDPANGTPLVYAAGHDHSLQVFRGAAGPRWLLVSGLGSSAKATPVRRDGASQFAHSDATHPGFMEIAFLSDGGVRLAVIEWSAETPTGTEVFSRNLISLPENR